MAGTTYNIKIVLSTNAGSARRDIDNIGDSARGAERGLQGAGRAAGAAGRDFASLGGLVREAAANFAGYLTAQAVFAGLQRAARFAYDTILGFDQQMTESLAIMGDQAEGTRRSMELTARSVAVEYNAAVQDVAQAYYFLASAGYDAETSQRAVGQVTAFAKAGMFDLEVATELAADAQNAMGLKSEDAGENLRQLTRITDVLTKANIDANGSVQDFAKALTNKAAAGARLAGVSLESTVAVLEAFAAQGLKGKRAGEAFTIVLRDLQDKSQMNAEAFKNLGVTVFDAEGKFAGFPKIIGQIEKGLAGMSVEQANATINTLGFTAEGGAYLKTLLGMSGAIADYEKKLQSAGGATQEIARKQMQSMAEQLKRLQVLAAELALKGFDKLVEGGKWLSDKFGPALSNIVAIVQDLATWLAPVGKAFATLAGGAVVGTLTAFAAVLQTVSKLLRDNVALIEMLATVALTALAAKAIMAGAAFLSMAADMAAFKAFDLAQYVDDVIAAVARFGPAFTAARAGGAGLASALAQATSAMFGTVGAAVAAGAGIAAIGVALYGVMKWYQQGEQAAEEFNRQVANKYNLSSLQGLRDSIRETQAEVDRLGKMGGSIGERFNLPEMVRASAEYDRLKDRVNELGDTLKNRESALWDMAKALKQGGEEGSNTALTIGQIHDRLDQIAGQEKIDPVSSEGAAKLKEIAERTLIATPGQQMLRDAFRQVADASATAEQNVDAYKKALDGLIGVHVSAQEAENQFAASLDTVNQKVVGGVNLLDAYNAKNREAREAVLGAVDAALNHAVSIYQETGSLDKANATLGFHREQLIQAMTQTGMSRKAAEDYIATLNLTPANILTLARLNKDQASAAALELTAQVNEAARHRTGEIVILTGKAQGSLAALHAQMDRVDARMRSMGGSITAVENMRRSEGGITLHQYAMGGRTDQDHIAQIAPAGAWRVWAEPETGGEAYIPLAARKRARSTAILESVAEMFGLRLVPGASVAAMDGWSSRAYSSSAMAGAANSVVRAVQVNMAPGMIQLTAGSGTDVVAMEAMLNRALGQFTRGLQRELRTRRVKRAA